MIQNWPIDKYDVVLLDVPWDHYGSPNKMGAAGKHYDLMPDDEVLVLPVSTLLHDNSVVFLWATGPRLDLALECLRHWGLYYRGVSFVWVKCKADGTPIGAQGVRPSIVKPLTEFVVAGSPQKRGRPLPLASESVVQTVFAPRREHSRKPSEVQDRIDDLYPNASKIELFCRGIPRANWHGWGKECHNGGALAFR